MVLPSKIRIGGVDYAVEFTENLNDGVNLAYGHIDFDKCLIRISSSIRMDDQKQEIVLLHEVLHGIINHLGLKLDSEEMIVDLLSKGLYQVYKDNAIVMIKSDRRPLTIEDFIKENEKN